MNSEYSANRLKITPNMRWTVELTDVIKCLLVEKADPTWKEPFHSEQVSALFRFLQGLLLVMAHYQDLSKALMDIIDLLVTEEKCLGYSENMPSVSFSDKFLAPHDWVGPGNVLHALFNWTSRDLPKATIPCGFSSQCAEVISKFTAAKPDLVDMKDGHSRTPLHYLLEGCFQDGGTELILVPTISLLATRNNVNAKDNNLVTPYTWVITAKHRREDEVQRKAALSDIEDILCRNGADIVTARDGLHVTM